MKVLLDTQVFLWLQAEPERLSARTLKWLAQPEHTLYLSAASAWEIAIKFALGKLPLPGAPHTWVPRRMSSAGISPLPVTHVHALKAGGLPAHHRDPFDRLLVAQAQVEKLALMTSDSQLSAYEVRVLGVG